MAGRPYYGRLHAVEHPQAAHIWRTRDEEPEDCAGSGLTTEQMADDRSDDIDRGARLWVLAEQALSKRQMMVLQMRLRMDMTLQDLADSMLVTSVRIRQIEQGALRRLRHAISAETEASDE
jgi:DNA-directed RNA polymerase sigma subunit (sigma70/sigma32)